MIITTIVGIYLHEITEQGSNRVDLLVAMFTTKKKILNMGDRIAVSR